MDLFLDEKRADDGRRRMKMINVLVNLIINRWIRLIMKYITQTENSKTKTPLLCHNDDKQSSYAIRLEGDRHITNICSHKLALANLENNSAIEIVVSFIGIVGRERMALKNILRVIDSS